MAGEGALGGRVTAGVFTAAGCVAESWVCLRTGELGRGALSQVPLFYSVSSGAVRFSTDIAELVGAAAPVWPAAVAAALDGVALSAPLTAYENVFQLSCGTSLKVTDGKERLELAEFDLAGLAECSREAVGRGSPSRVLRRALAHAGEDALGAAATGWLGDGGGMGAAAVAAACAERLRRVHVHVEVPVLARRRTRLAPGATVLDGTPGWLREGGESDLRYLHQAHPWLPGPELLGAERARLLSGGALYRAMTGPPAALGRLRAGWVQLASVSAPPILRGRRGRDAWLNLDELAPSAQPAVHSFPGGGEREWLVPGAWMSQRARTARAPVSAAGAPSHLVEGQEVGFALGAVIDALEATPLTVVQPRHLEPVLVCAHPVVMGVIARLARQGRLRRRLRSGHVDPAPVLRGLLPPQWRPADVAPWEHEKLLAAAFVMRHLATPQQRTRLLERVGSSPWIDADRLAAVLGDPRKALTDAAALYRLCVTAQRHGEALHQAVS